MSNNRWKTFDDTLPAVTSRVVNRRYVSAEGVILPVGDTNGTEVVKVYGVDGVNPFTQYIDAITADPFITGNILSLKPINISPPFASGIGYAGYTLTTSNGSWIGNPVTVFSYQWQRNGINISGATAQTYIVTTVDEGVPLSCVVTASNDEGIGVSQSNSIEQWIPTDIETSLWLDASDSSTIILNGSNVSQWTDKSGKSNHLVQNTVGNQPTLVGNSIVSSSGKSLAKTPAIDTLNAQGTTSLFIVHDVINATTASANFTTIFRNSSVDTDPTKRRPFVIYAKVANTINFSNSSSDAVVLTSTSTKTGKTLFSYTQSETQATLYSQGSFVHQIANTPNTNTTSETLVIGNFSDVNNNMIINACILINGLVSEDNRQKIEGYLAYKWELLSNLPSDHPYKNNPPTV
jgi:hypothetical protein